MKPNPIATRALVGTLPALALFATPVLAQEAAQPAAPPPAAVAPPPPVATPAPAAASGPSAEDRAKYEASVAAATGTATAAAEAAPATEAVRRAPVRAARPTARSAAPARVPVRAPAAVTSAPAAPVAATPVTTTPVPAVDPAPAPAASAPVADAPMTTPVPDEPAAVATDEGQTTATTETTTRSGGFPLWGWVLGGLAVLAALAALVIARRRREERGWREEALYDDEPTYERPVAAAPIAAAPLAAAPVIPVVADEEHAEVAAPAADEVAAITAASEPVTGRPWIELSLRPLRAGATDDSAIVDLELTLANAGEIAARDVRVSTFMLGDAGDAPDPQGLLASDRGGNEVNAGEIGAGEGSRVDATLSVPRSDLDGPTFQPIVVADVRYTLPDGGEGRTAAAFSVGVNDGTEEPTPLRLGGDLREDVAATLHSVLERV